MKRAFSLVELLSVASLVFIIAVALTQSVFKAKTQAKIAKARTEMASIVAEVKLAKNPEAAAAYYEQGNVKDPWGNAYRVTVRRTVMTGEGLKDCTSAVWYPNAYSPKGGGR